MTMRKQRFSIISYLSLFLVLLLASVVVYQMIYVARLETVAHRLVMREESLLESNRELIKLIHGHEKPTYLDATIDVVNIHHRGKVSNERGDEKALQ